MSIRARMAAGVLFAAVVSASLLGMLLFSVALSQRADACVAHATQISDAVFDLTLLTGDYSVTPGDRAAQQWRARYQALGELLGGSFACEETTGKLSEALRPDYERLGQLFSELTDHAQVLETQPGTGVLSPYGVRVADQMRISAQSLSSETLSFRQALQDQQAAARARILVLAMVLASVSIATLGFFTWSSWRLVAEPLGRLRDGARALEAGNLEYRFGQTRQDEVGEVAHAFDEMADTLAVSHRALQAEIAERRAAEQRVRQSKREVEQVVERRTAQLLETNRQLAEATEAKDRFMARMSHELRTPLNSVIGFSSIILSGAAGPLTEEQTTQLQMISRGGTRLLALVNDLLDISVIASGGVEIECTDVDIAEFGREVALAIEPLARTQGLAFDYECTASGTIYTDRTRLEQIVMNLLGNAVKFTQQGSVGLSISSARAVDVHFSVTDTGIGIDPERLSDVFDEFTQLAPPKDRVHEGTGLGLAIARSLSAILGGEITAQSTPGEGSRFTVTLPARACYNNSRTL